MADVGTLQKRLSDRAELTRFEKNNRSDEELYYMEKGIEILKKNGILICLHFPIRVRLLNDLIL